MWSYRDQD